jgi:hypothetical protein
MLGERVVGTGDPTHRGDALSQCRFGSEINVSERDRGVHQRL